MVIDTSALVAILENEPERRVLTERLEEDESRFLSAATLVETSIVVEARRGLDGVHDLDLLLSKARVEVIAVDAEQAYVARNAFRAYGKGRHRAGLNLGDCFVYALAKSFGEPVLHKGDDFAHTDIARVPLE
jgi:ribonuclease VapC